MKLTIGQNKSPERLGRGYRGLAYGVLLRFRDKTRIKTLFGRTHTILALYRTVLAPAGSWQFMRYR